MQLTSGAAAGLRAQQQLTTGPRHIIVLAPPPLAPPATATASACSHAASGSAATAPLWTQPPQERRTARQGARRRHVAAAAAASPRQPDALWAYEGTQVQPMNLETLRAVHRLSYGHRGRRTVLIVAYDPQNAACRQAEWEVERLATGLRGAPHVLVAGLNVRTAHLTTGSSTVNAGGAKSPPLTTREFLASVTSARQLPLLLLYPEGAPGLLSLKHGPNQPLTAEAICAALNSCQATVLPGRPPLKLDDSVLASAAAPPAATTAATFAAPPAQASPQAAVASAGGGGAGGLLSPAVASYWTPGKAAFWLGILALSVLSVVWERWLGPALEARALRARQQARQLSAAGQQPAGEEDPDAALDDLFRLRAAQAQPDSDAAGPGGAPVPLGAARSLLLKRPTQAPPPGHEGFAERGLP